MIGGKTILPTSVDTALKPAHICGYALRPQTCPVANMAPKHAHLCRCGTQTCPPLWIWHPTCPHVCIWHPNLPTSVDMAHKPDLLCGYGTNLPTFVDMAYKPAHLCGYGTQTCPPLPLWHTILPTSANMAPKLAHLCEYNTQTCPPLQIWHTNLPKAQKTRQ